MGRVVVSGGAGFLGSHLCEALLNRGDRVICVDNFSTSTDRSISHLMTDPQFSFINQDITDQLTVESPIDYVLHFASPASPSDYLRLPLQTLKAGSIGTWNMLELARASSATFLLASTSEVYGDPAVHPQSETYWGSVNPIGPRSVYDEAKRFAEALSMAYHRTYDVEIRIARIFNTYGPGMSPDDGRVVSNFIAQAITNRPITIYGTGDQTRSFCYVDDLVRGLLGLLDSDHVGPVNVGNPIEYRVRDLAAVVIEATQSSSAISYKPLPVDDPHRRKPDVSLAERLLGWRPEIDLQTGICRTADWMRSAFFGEDQES